MKKQQTEEQRKYKVFTKKIDQFFKQLDQNIIAKRDFTCCNNCGSSDICKIVENSDNPDFYWGYIFYHIQETDYIKETIMNEESIIHLGWDVFKDDCTADEYDKFADKIVHEADVFETTIREKEPEFQFRIEYDRVAKGKTKLMLYVRIPESLYKTSNV